MRHLIAIATTLMLALFMTACTKKGTTLTVIQAPRGEIIRDRELGYKLVLEEPHSVGVWFADRPERHAGYIHIEDFLHAWTTGDNSFKKNPPNALLIVEDNEPLMVELILARWNQNEAIFKIKMLAGERYDTTSHEHFSYDIAKEHFPEFFKVPVTVIFNPDS